MDVHGLWIKPVLRGTDAPSDFCSLLFSPSYSWSVTGVSLTSFPTDLMAAQNFWRNVLRLVQHFPVVLDMNLPKLYNGIAGPGQCCRARAPGWLRRWVQERARRPCSLSMQRLLPLSVHHRRHHLQTVVLALGTAMGGRERHKIPWRNGEVSAEHLAE